MYLPRNKYKIEYISDSSIVDSTGTVYVGPVLKTSSGKIFKGDSLENVGEQVFPVGDYQNTIELDTPFNVYLEPTEEDYQRGFYTRYFIRQTGNHNYKEVDRKQYIKFNNEESYLTGKITWYLKGPADDQLIKGYLLEGTKEKNKKSLLEIENNFPYILEKINTSQFIK